MDEVKEGGKQKMSTLCTHPAPAPSFLQNLPVNHLFTLPRMLDWVMITGGKAVKGTSQVLLRWSNPFLRSWRFGDFNADRVAALMLFALMASGPQKAAGLFDLLAVPSVVVSTWGVVLLGLVPSSASPLLS